MDMQVLVPIKDTLTWKTGKITLGDCLRDFLWDVLENEGYSSDIIEELMCWGIPTIQIDGAYFVVSLKENQNV